MDLFETVYYGSKDRSEVLQEALLNEMNYGNPGLYCIYRSGERRPTRIVGFGMQPMSLKSAEEALYKLNNPSYSIVEVIEAKDGSIQPKPGQQRDIIVNINKTAHLKMGAGPVKQANKVPRNLFNLF
jgi:hypothetical protein